MSNCILWTGAKTTDGYGYRKQNKKNIKLHRETYEKFNGLIPKGKVVRHTCDIRNCINPEHLILGTQADNCKDMYQRNRDKHPTGEYHGRAKLNWNAIMFIRSNYKRYDKVYNLVTLGQKFGVDPSVIKDVVDNKIWIDINA